MNTCFAFLPLGFIGNFQGWEWIIVLVVILLLFGGKKLPELARGAGKAIREFKKISNETEETFKKAMNEEEEAAQKKPATDEWKHLAEKADAKEKANAPDEPKAQG